MADKTDSVTPSQPGERNSTANHANRRSVRRPCANGYSHPPKPTPPPKPPHLTNMYRNGERPRRAVRPRSSVIPVNGNGSSIDALADSQLQIQLAFSTWFNSVLLNSHLAVESSIKELSVNAGICMTTTLSSSSLFILKVTISTTSEIFKRLPDWETDLTTAVKSAESSLRTWTILTGATVVKIHTAADTGGDPPETATVDIFCNRPSGLGGNAVDAVHRALLGPDDPRIFPRAGVHIKNVNVVVTYSN